MNATQRLAILEEGHAILIALVHELNVLLYEGEQHLAAIEFLDRIENTK
jgi:hypothetical protein